ncbi:MAG: phage head-tail connector protein [Defluviitaleaceae bacterium]|nr:phage head-tail connector protein [Defluviitaleaceae bacterium]
MARRLLNVETLLRDIKVQLGITGAEADDVLTLMIRDAIRAALDYCHVKRLPAEAGYIIREMVIGRFRADNGENIDSVRRGDTQVTYHSTIDVNAFSERQRSGLNAYRRIVMR